MTLPEPFEALLARSPESLRVAVVGASNDERKFGSIILRAVASRGSVAVPVTPSSDLVHGIAAFSALGAAANAVDFANVVVAPVRALDALKTLPPGSQLPVWFQPGAYDDEVLAWCMHRAVPYLFGPCILVEFAARVRRGAGNA